MNIRNTMLGLCYLGATTCLVLQTGGYVYRSYQISQAPMQRDYSLSEGRTESILGVMQRGGVFDRDEDGSVDEIIEVGGITGRFFPGSVGWMPTNRVLHPSDSEFNGRLKLFK